MQRSAWIVIALCFGLGATACNSPSTDLKVPSVQPTGTPVKGLEINLRTVDEKEFAEVVAKHKGRVVLVDFWATWCGPCVEGFPHTVELHNRYEKQGLATVSVSFDAPEDDVKVREFLAAQGANFDNLLSKYGTALVDAANAFEFEGALPHYRLYDRSGKLRQSWSPEKSQPEELEMLLQELLAEKA